MYSLVILFSNDRLKQLNAMVDCWKYLAEDFDECEKILCVDGKLSERPVGDWQVLEIPRRGPHYCWADVLNAGVQAASQSYVFYYDSDRIIPQGHVQYCLEVLRQRAVYIYAPRLYAFWKEVLDRPTLCHAVHEPEACLSTCLYPDFRVSNPEHYEHKNPFSGGVAFRKATFLEHGGFDPRYVGWGYPDFDFFQHVTRLGVELVQVPTAELHLQHPYQADKRTVELHNAWNCWQYVEKWQLDRQFVDQFWQQLNLPMAARDCHNLSEFLACV